MTRDTQTISSTADESDIQINWTGCRSADNPIIQDAIKRYPGIDWDDSPLPGEIEQMTPAERSAQWRRLNPAKSVQQRRRYYRRIQAGGPNPTKAERLELLATVAYSCQCCHRHQSELDEPLVLDHIRPVSRRGLNAISNRQVLCGQCNRKKGAKSTDYRHRSTV
jgi:5-methylcytosine-specific restriction endonuclease McrA